MPTLPHPPVTHVGGWRPLVVVLVCYSRHEGALPLAGAAAHRRAGTGGHGATATTAARAVAADSLVARYADLEGSHFTFFFFLRQILLC